jgi:peptidoglycan/xylan/chitin deacetylase (PgdA/CDA1 family)
MIRVGALAMVLSAMVPWKHAAVAAGPAAVVFMYHRFGEDRYPSTNTTLAQLDAQIAYLKDNAFTVLPLVDVVDALKSGRALPEKSAAITIDDAYTSVIRESWPRFKRAGFSFTVFVATAAIDAREPGIMSWDDLRALAADGVGIGGHGHAHAHLPALDLDGVRADLAAMNGRFATELGSRPTLFAYPYGEAGIEDMRAVEAAGFTAAFCQNSGPVYAEANLYYLPRFALNETYGAMERFRMVANTLPLRAVGLSPPSPVLERNPPRLTFTVVDAPVLDGVSCFDPGGDRAAVEVAGAAVSVEPSSPFPTGRARVNCTVRADGRWYWWGHEMIAGGASEGVAMHSRHRRSPRE